ncbi:hypothetical protein GCM10022419_132610 [Nonomuraea rosea]|uniref:Uncharacterized protein n=1 Tax=Nonomuraea rosea TaxID=638574 RepID=A0ABP7A3W2_9ACTN
MGTMKGPSPPAITQIRAHLPPRAAGRYRRPLPPLLLRPTAGPSRASSTQLTTLVFAADHTAACQWPRQDGNGPVSERSAMVAAMHGSAMAVPGLRQAYEDKIVLDGIDLDVRRGSRAGA